jgi:hypothetical protein
MKRLPKPIENGFSNFTNCISKIRKPGLKSRLASVGHLIAQAEAEYEYNAQNSALHTFSSTEGINGIVSQDEIEKVYTNSMVGKNAPGRALYDKLILSIPNRICPLCGQRTVTTLDHHLPKAKYPFFVVTPINLVPACSDCNKLKRGDKLMNAFDQTIHPYYDNCEDDVWLNAEVIESLPTTIRFFVQPPSTWSRELSEKAKFHFDKLELAILYGSHAAVELGNIRHAISNLHSISGPTSVMSHLETIATSCQSFNKNSWQTALYTSISSNIWFCSTGFRS